jgi:hypothetical protein
MKTTRKSKFLNLKMKTKNGSFGAKTIPLNIWTGKVPNGYPNLKPSTKAISLRLPESLLDAIRQMANERDVPYQSLIKMFLQERIEQDFKSRHLPSG